MVELAGTAQLGDHDPEAIPEDLVYLTCSKRMLCQEFIDNRILDPLILPFKCSVTSAALINMIPSFLAFHGEGCPCYGTIRRAGSTQ